MHQRIPNTALFSKNKSNLVSLVYQEVYTKMYVVYGAQSRVIQFHATRHYMPEEVLQKLENVLRAHGHVRLSYEGEILVLQKEDLRVASFVLAAHHNGLCNGLPSPDNWATETKQMEMQAEQHMLEDSSTEEDEFVQDDPDADEYWDTQ